MNKPLNLIDVFNANRNDDKGITFINNSAEEYFISYDQLFINAQYLLNDLNRSNVKEGDYVYFQLNDLERFITLFWACVMGKIVPIPIEIGGSLDRNKKLYNIWKVLGSGFVVCDELGLISKINEHIKDVSFLDFFEKYSVQYTDLDTKSKFGEIKEIDGDDLCYIQFSSGSTGLPKGVPLTHKNILTNVYDIINVHKVTSDDSFISWKPLVHDFSMTAFHITPLVANTNHYRIPTQVFIKTPAIWMEAVNKHKITILGSPNFGFRHFLKFYDRGVNNSNWDLSSVRIIFNGAETISYKLLDEFFDSMAPYGLDKYSIIPGFGLAEATLIVSVCPMREPIKVHSIDRRNTAIGERIKYLETGNEYAINFVDCGVPLPSNQVSIANEKNETLPDEYIGFIKVKGGNVIKEYFKNPEASAKTVIDGWVNTGDLGFLKNGRLTFTGRAKEIIVINGANFYPYDIEEVLLNELNYGDLNKYVACGCYNHEKGKEELIIFAFHKAKIEHFAPLALKIRQVITQKMGLLVDKVIPTKVIPKTTSGKIRRHQLVDEYINGEFDAVLSELKALTPQKIVYVEALTRDELIVLIQDKIEEVTSLSVDDIESSFFDLGVKSMHIMVLKDELKEIFNVDLKATDLFDYPSVDSLAGYILEGMKAN